MILISGGCYKIWKIPKSSVNTSQTSFKEKAQTKKIVIPSQLSPVEVLAQIYGEDAPLPIPFEDPNDISLKDFLGIKPNKGFIVAVEGVYQNAYWLTDGRRIKNNLPPFVLRFLIVKYKTPQYASQDYRTLSSFWRTKGYVLEGNREEMYKKYKKIKEDLLQPKGSNKVVVFLSGKGKSITVKGIPATYRPVYWDTNYFEYKKDNLPFIIEKTYLFSLGNFLIYIGGTSEEAINDTFDRIIKAFGNY